MLIGSIKLNRAETEGCENVRFSVFSADCGTGAFKGMDGVKHVAAFLTSSEPQVIQAHPASSQVIMNNCIRCHEQLNTELVRPAA